MRPNFACKLLKMIGRNLTDAVDGILKGKRLRFTDDQRRRLAVKAKGLGTEGVTRVGPARHTLAWHRRAGS